MHVFVQQTLAQYCFRGSEHLNGAKSRALPSRDLQGHKSISCPSSRRPAHAAHWACAPSPPPLRRRGSLHLVEEAEAQGRSSDPPSRVPSEASRGRMARRPLVENPRTLWCSSQATLPLRWLLRGSPAIPFCYCHQFSPLQPPADHRDHLLSSQPSANQQRDLTSTS